MGLMLRAASTGGEKPAFTCIGRLRGEGGAGIANWPGFAQWNGFRFASGMEGWRIPLGLGDRRAGPGDKGLGLRLRSRCGARSCGKDMDKLPVLLRSGMASGALLAAKSCSDGDIACTPSSPPNLRLSILMGLDGLLVLKALPLLNAPLGLPGAHAG